MITYARAWYGSRYGNSEGATAVEYGIMVALIAVVIIVVVGLIGTSLRDKFQTVADSLQ